MTMRPTPPPIPPPSSSALRAPLLRVLLAGLLGVAAALLISCSGSGKGLIPTGNAGPLQSDFEAVAQAAQSGDCTATAAALLKTQQDFDALPASIDAGLRKRLSEGISKLHSDALEACREPLPQATATTTTPRTTTSTATTPSTPTVTQTTPTQTTPTTSTPAPSGPGGGTPAPGSEPAPGAGSESGGGAGAGEAGGAAGGAKVGGGQEAGGK